MYTRIDRAHRAIPVILGVLTLLCGTLALAWDVYPALFSPAAHIFFATAALALIAIAYLIYQTVHRPTRQEWLKAILLAIAFLFWAANQFWPNPQQATLFNDIAIALFVLDVFLVMVGWPATSPDESFAETYVEPEK